MWFARGIAGLTCATNYLCQACELATSNPPDFEKKDDRFNTFQTVIECITTFCILQTSDDIYEALMPTRESIMLAGC